MWNNEKDKNIYIVMIILFIFTLIISVFLRLQIKSSNDNISKFKTEILKENQTCNSINWNNPYDKRLENIEQKYIDVYASSQTINFWITIFSILIPIIIWIGIYQKWKFEDEARKELEKVREFAEKTRDKIDNIDKIIDSKIKKISISAKDETRKIISEADNQRKIIEYFNEWVKHNNEWKHEDAIKEYGKALKISDNLSWTHNNIGLSLSKLWRLSESINSYNKAIKINKKNFTAYNNRWATLLKQKKYNDALEDFNKAIELDNKYTNAYYNLAIIYWIKNDLKNSLYNLEKCLKLWFFDDKEKISKFYKNKNFDDIKNTPEFKNFINKLEEKYPKNI